MKTCVVKGCGSTSLKNSNLMFFPFPKNSIMRQEWLGVLSLKEKEATDGTVCELHFREKDFRGASRKLLKPHVSPFVKGNKLNEDNSDDEFMRCDDSGSDPEIVEVKRISKEMANIKEEPKETKPVKEQTDSPPAAPPAETENVGRRPSRRAAQLAVQKIHNSVRQFGMTENVIEEPEVAPIPSLSSVKVEPKPRRVSSPKVVTKRSRETRDWHAIRAPVPDIDLIMECHEELLSAVQAETILKAQMEYNAVMKRLRNLKASNARIICINSDEEMPLSHVPILPAPQKSPNIVTLTPAGTNSNSNVITVVPVHLVTVQSQSNSIKQPGSPAVFANITAD